MLIEFRVSNFRSVKDEQVLSLVASKDKDMMESNVCETGMKSVPGILRSATIYGANASGKSTLIGALKYMQAVVLRSATQLPDGFIFDITPFLFDEATASSPSSFEVTFLVDGIRYQYGFSMTGERVFSEHLLVYRKFKPQQWFSRYFDEKKDRDIYEFKTGLTGSKHVWQEATRPDALFLSVAAQLNSADIKPVYDWFLQGLEVIHGYEGISTKFSAQLLKKNENKNLIINFLNSADININDIEVRNEKVQNHNIKVDHRSGNTGFIEGKAEDHKILFYHPGKNGNIAIDFHDESDGTKMLFALIGPCLDILKKGKVLIVDELDTSLHPLLLRALIKLFQDTTNNTGNAQLIFSTHDTSLLNTFGLFRRDQIYLTEMGKDQATELVSLAEFSPRKTENIERGYLSGRYGGIPFIDPDLKLRV